MKALFTPLFFTPFLALSALCTGCEFWTPPSEETRPTGQNPFQIVTGGDAEEERESWNAKYRSQSFGKGREPAPFLKEHLHFLPKGDLLIFPLEEGTNALFLAKNGFRVTGIDYSDQAIRKAQKRARAEHASLRGINGDLNSLEFETSRYDVIVALDLYRLRLIDQIKRALRPDGVVLYGARILPEKYAGNAASRFVRPGEFKTLFSDFKIVFYEERDIPNQTERMAYVIARKKAND